jgi:hypothetical protein
MHRKLYLNIDEGLSWLQGDDRTISFRYNDMTNGRLKTECWGATDHSIKLSEAWELLAEPNKTFAAARSPARQKVAAAVRRNAENSFDEWPRSGSTATRWPS